MMVWVAFLEQGLFKEIDGGWVAVYPFLPFKFGRFFSSFKIIETIARIIVVDGHSGFTGGINVIGQNLKGDVELAIGTTCI